MAWIVSSVQDVTLDDSLPTPRIRHFKKRRARPY
jgi:hypothetical protein